MSNETRLEAFRLLVKAGILAGEISERLLSLEYRCSKTIEAWIMRDHYPFIQ